MKTKRSKAAEEHQVDEECTKRDEEASSTMKLAMDTLARGLESVRSTHRTAKRVRASVDAIDTSISYPRLVAVKK